jgi:hypothetical protein
MSVKLGGKEDKSGTGKRTNPAQERGQIEQNPPTPPYKEYSLHEPSIEPSKTHTQQPDNKSGNGVGVWDKKTGSKFSIEECKRYAQHLHKTGQGITNPGGYATAIFRSGEADSLIEAWLNLPAKLDVSACPDCEGRGMFYVDPTNHDKGVKPCKHPQLGGGP